MIDLVHISESLWYSVLYVTKRVRKSGKGTSGMHRRGFELFYLSTYTQKSYTA
jgi:hypothetical protein